MTKEQKTAMKCRSSEDAVTQVIHFAMRRKWKLVLETSKQSLKVLLPLGAMLNQTCIHLCKLRRIPIAEPLGPALLHGKNASHYRNVTYCRRQYGQNCQQDESPTPCVLQSIQCHKSTGASDRNGQALNCVQNSSCRQTLLPACRRSVSP